jgi:predicted transposase/invertase (TIGR01784 family)
MKKNNSQGNSKENSQNVNREHKASMFSSLFGNPDVLRELYSAIEGIPIPPDIPVEINTLSDVLFKDKINDLSFLIDNRLVVLIEHQSTINNNIPLRLLIYIAYIYKTIVKKRNLYEKKLKKIPFPEFIVLYNGNAKYPDHKELRLSNAFKGIKGLKMADAIPLELKVQVYNINHGHNTEILKKCETLDNYSFLIDKIREYQKKRIKLEEAIKNAIKYCIENNILKEYLEKHGSEAYNMIFSEWIWDEALEVAHEEGWEDGLEEGMEKGREEGREEGIEFTARNALSKGIPVQTVQEITGLSLEKIVELTPNP